MKKILEWAALLAAFLALAGCAEKEAVEPKWEKSLYRTVAYITFRSAPQKSQAKFVVLIVKISC